MKHYIYEMMSFIGIVLGVISFIWRLIDAFRSYLHIEVLINQEKYKKNTQLNALVTVQNTGISPKSINYAFLLIGPEEENPIDTAKKLSRLIKVNNKINFTNDFSILKTDVPKYDGRNRALIPLPFFFDEQVRIADEVIHYRCSINPKKFQRNKIYSARFYIFGRYHLHRSTQDLFIIV